MDINVRKETVFDGAGVSLLPVAPALMILEGGSAESTATTAMAVATAAPAVRGRSKKDRGEEISRLIGAVMKTLRDGANVLIPCDTGARLLELLHTFSQYWVDNKLGLYNLVFLSHMSHNVVEFAKSQLEWMADTLSKPFFNARPNPFDLPAVKLFASVREMERQCPGPKLVFATDASLSCGLSKELLLRWGGDPRCKLIFIDTADPGTLAAEIQQQMMSPPIIVTVTRPQKVELVGEELNKFAHGESVFL
jgi:cleavage and polyadenylation specificity factor subunit 2